MPEMIEHQLRIGESARLKKTFFREICVVYAGMAAEHVHSLAVTHSWGHNALAYNLYVSRTVRQIHVIKEQIEILDFGTDYIRFRHLK